MFHSETIRDPLLRVSLKAIVTRGTGKRCALQHEILKASAANNTLKKCHVHHKMNRDKAPPSKNNSKGVVSP